MTSTQTPSAAASADEMGPETYREALVHAHVLAQLLRELPLVAMLEVVALAEAAAPIVDPTSWIANGEKFRQDAEVLRALRGAQERIEKLHAEVTHGR